MNVWLVTIGEPLPSDGPLVRLLRAGSFAQHLTREGHDVTWWTSAFDHSHKRQRSDRDTTIEFNAGFRIEMLRGPAYSRNVSARRILNHLIVSRRFSRRSRVKPVPDVIVSSLPTVELSLACVKYGRLNRVPVVIDVRDLWPDIFWDAVPPRWKRVATVAKRPLTTAVRRALSGAFAVWGISRGYLDWAIRYAERPQTGLDGVFPLGYDRPDVSEAQVVSAGEGLRSIGVEPSRLQCVFIGTFGRTYDLSTVISAARELNRQGDDQIQFVLCGHGEREDEWRRAAAGLDNVVFPGWVDAAQLTYLLGLRTVGLAAYARNAPQSIPNKFFEYMSGGAPVLSSLQGEGAEFLKENSCGLTYMPGDPASFLSALTDLRAQNALRRRLGNNALEVFNAKYSAVAVNRGMIASLHEIIAAHSTETRTSA